MEGVPRLYMIGIPAKRCADNHTPDFATALNHHIRQSYGRDPSLYSADIDTLLGLRQSAMNAVMSSVCSVNDCTALKRYYAHLVRITDKFPKLMQQKIVGVKEPYEDVAITKIEEPTPALTFTWKRTLGGKTNRCINDIDAASLVVDSGDIGYEMRCVLYNLGAAHSRLASAQDRSPPLVTSNTSTTAGEESPSNTALKIACTHLQCSAWAFQQLLGNGENNNEHTKWHHRQQPPVTSRAVLEFAYNVTLAQAQECILEKSMMDGRKPLIIAKVSAMICEYFAGAVNAVLRVEREPYCVSASRIEKWRLYSEFKCRYYGAITALFQGQHVQDQLQQMGTRVSYYRRAVNLLGRAGQISENGGKSMTLVSREDDSADDDYYYYLDSEVGRIGSGRLAATKELEMRRDTLSFAMDVAAAKWRAAKSENELIYHEPVIPVLSDEDDSDCLGNSSSSTSSSQHHNLDRVKGASLVKPIGFSVDDPELLAVVVSNNESSSFTSTVTTLFRDIVPTVSRNRAATYRTEKRAMEAYVQSLCQEADDRLTKFVDRLHLECLDMYKNYSNEYENDENNIKNELPQQLVNCCAAYQALLHQRREERERDPSSANKEDQLDIDMDRLSAAVQAVDGMLDEIDRLLKTEELGDSEYRRTVGRPYDYSAGRMRELRREASRYREAHVGRARDSWVTLSRAVRDRRRRDLELLALPPDELAARLPPARPSISAIASEVATADGIDSTSSYNSAAESSDPNEDSESDDNTGGRLRQSKRESIMRLDRLKMVVDKMQEVREQRQMLLSKLREEMNREDKEAAAAGQDDSDVLVELRGSNLDVSMAVKKKLDDQYGTMVNLIERNLVAQQNVLDGVRTAYACAARERRAYANAMERRRTVIASLLDAYESFLIANGGTPSETNSDMVTASPTSGILPDTVLAERCAKGLDFYQRMLTNVSKLLQRVKGACQVQTEQRDQIIKQHRQWEQQPEDDLTTNIGGLDDLLAAVSTVDNQDHNQEDLAVLIKNFGSSVGSNKPSVPLGGHWNQQHHLRRLSPLGSEQQKQHYHQYSHSQTQLPSSSTFTTGVSGDVIGYYDYYHDDQSDIKANTGHNGNINTAQQQQQSAAHTMFPPVTAEYNVSVGSTAIASSINSTAASLSSPRSSSVLAYNYYNYQLPTANLATNPSLSSASYNNVNTITGSTTDIPATSLLNTTRMGANSGNSVFPSAAAAAAVAALQRPLPTPYSIGNGSTIANITTGISYGASRSFGYHQPSHVLPTQQPQFYSQRYQQPISTLPSISDDTTGVGTAGVFLQQQQQLITNGSISVSLQSPLPLSSPSISSISVNNSGPATSVNSSIAITSGSNTFTNANYFNQLPAQQQQLQLYQQQQSQLYQQQQQPQLYQQQSQLYQQQQPQMYQQLQQTQLKNIGQNTSGILHYPTSLQQHQQPSQLYQSQNQLQSNTSTTNLQQPSSSLSNNSVNGNNYYQQLPQYQPSTTVASVTPNNTTMALNNYYYQQPSMATTPVIFSQNQQQSQYYQQQLPAVTSISTPVVNLLDDDLQISGPPPIQPEKISIIGGNDNNTTTSTANIIK